jgi:hypothetical protein
MHNSFIAVNEEEQAAARRMRGWTNWQQLFKAAGKIRGEKWDQWAERHGDWGRDGGLRLAEVVRQVGMKYQTAAQGVKRFGHVLAADPDRKRLKRFVAKLNAISKI